MDIEVYDVKELDSDLTEEEQGAQLAMIDRLGLEGQKELIGEDKEVCPFRKMTNQEKMVYETLFPKCTLVTEYSDGVVPMRAMQVLEQANKLNKFDYFVVWHPENADDPDPLLLGLVGDNTYNPTEIWMLARWGEALESFEALKKKAEELKYIKYVGLLKDIKARVASALNSAEEMTPSEYFAAKGDASEPWANF